MSNKKFTELKQLSPFFNGKRIPRKLKKQIKKTLGNSFKTLTNEQALWEFLGIINPDYKFFLIEKMITHSN